MFNKPCSIYQYWAYGTLRNETKRNLMVLCETVLCEMVLCKMINHKICKLVANYKANLASNWNGFVFVSQGSIFTLGTPRLVNTK